MTHHPKQVISMNFYTSNPLGPLWLIDLLEQGKMTSLSLVAAVKNDMKSVRTKHMV